MIWWLWPFLNERATAAVSGVRTCQGLLCPNTTLRFASQVQMLLWPVGRAAGAKRILWVRVVRNVSPLSVKTGKRRLTRNRAAPLFGDCVACNGRRAHLAARFVVQLNRASHQSHVRAHAVGRLYRPCCVRFINMRIELILPDLKLASQPKAPLRRQRLASSLVILTCI